LSADAELCAAAALVLDESLELEVARALSLGGEPGGGGGPIA
jgi:hypothetical protein